ncbi:MAG: hypothetical protein ACNS60_15125 [Candidatus Cyclobacteriaceae bacterium M2_1C_046]
MKYLFSAGSLAVLLTFFSCDTEADYAYTDWDTNVDERIDEEEFRAAYDDIGYYEAWDIDQDDLIDEKEWEMGISEYYPDYDYELEGAYEDWDIDEDDFLDRDEYLMGSYTLWDVDGDGFVEEVEYGDYYYDL